MNELLFYVLVFVFIIFSFAGAFVIFVFKAAFFILADHADEQTVIELNNLLDNILNLMNERLNND